MPQTLRGDGDDSSDIDRLHHRCRLLVGPIDLRVGTAPQFPHNHLNGSPAGSPDQGTDEGAPPAGDPHVARVEDKLRERFGTKVQLRYSQGKGAVEIAFFSDDDLQRVLEILNIPYTGASSGNMFVCNNKALSKKIFTFKSKK